MFHLLGQMWKTMSNQGPISHSKGLLWDYGQEYNIPNLMVCCQDEYIFKIARSLDSMLVGSTQVPQIGAYMHNLN